MNVTDLDSKLARGMDAQSGEGNEITLSTGVVLIAKPANPTMLIRAMTLHRRPDPPTVHVEAMGRYMENPDDPDYISRVKNWEMSYSSTLLNVLIAQGTELKSVPKGMEGPHPKGDKRPAWIADYQSFGFPVVPDSPTWRYMTWIMFKAAPLDTDIKLIQSKVQALSGVKEADVRDAENFPASN
ncbi:MAG: hypothetical protein E6R03_13385 [Hyphomicrobiaceae bacterium]|nr:MAG: hypothetical protein E6R03_13385 [Hyphomicrobiaceae bacterium]